MQSVYIVTNIWLEKETNAILRIAAFAAFNRPFGFSETARAEHALDNLEICIRVGIRFRINITEQERNAIKYTHATVQLRNKKDVSTDETIHYGDMALGKNGACTPVIDIYSNYISHAYATQLYVDIGTEDETILYAIVDFGPILAGPIDIDTTNAHVTHY